MNDKIQKAIEDVYAKQEKFRQSLEEFCDALIRLQDANEELKRWV